MPLDEVSKVDWVVPPSIDMQLMDGVTLLDNQGDEKAKKKQSKGDGDLLKTISWARPHAQYNCNL